MSTAKLIAQRLTARLQAITQANGYRSNLGQHVYRGRLAIDEDTPASVTIAELDEDGTQKPGRRSALCKLTQRYALEALAHCDPDHPNDAAHDLIHDIQRAIFGPLDPTLGGAAADLRYLTRRINPRDFGTTRVLASVEIEVDYVEDLAAP
ncbi:hypothetical protein [Thauera aromatica]|uniref:hypothetical protein n=1 Tax=Thauera aromatica TaxID=59405 RepID=UPI001FFDC9A7|nr:hypothetical protein [Thauera aromatica]MCK2095229.1 hypothetical protein [Thauera aromatica]